RATSPEGYDASTTHLALLRFTSEGSLDDSFGDNGIAEIDVATRNGLCQERCSENPVVMTLLPDGRILVFTQATGSGGVLVLLSSDGRVDPSLLDEGFRELRANGDDVRLLDLVAQPDGGVIGVGHTAVETPLYPLWEYLIVKLREDLEFDEDFADGGVLTMTGETILYRKLVSVAVQESGRILTTGGASFPYSPLGESLFLGFTPSGTLDPTFGDLGFATGGGAISFDSEGGIVTWGGTTLARYSEDGQPDIGFGTDGFVQVQ